MRRLTLLILFMLAAGAAMAETPAPPGAGAYIISPGNGEIVHNPVTVRFGLQNMGVAPAGVDVKNTGHHHLLIDTVVPPLDQPIPGDDNHRHFGGGQTGATINLAPGTHTLQLLLGDKNHIPHAPPVVSKPITITVE